MGEASSSSNEESKRAIAPLIAGVLGGAASTVSLYPLDLIKVRMQVNESSSSGNLKDSQQAERRAMSSIRVFRAVVRQEGVAGLYQGLSPAVIGSAFSWGGYFFVYEGMKRRYGNYKEPTNTTGRYHFNAGETFVLACASGSVLVALTNPIWLIKTRMQLQLKQTTQPLGKHKAPYTGIADAARTIVREEGATALYKGAIPALFLTSHGGVQFMVYEYLKKSFHYTRAKRDSSSNITERFNQSLGFLAMGAASKM
jgi:solute carrier family 25 folate transporter 32